jgi:NADPH-dependent 2,4-dienoyl-CoA reductase/sulfur reductase-like enzyme/nitrite reductase/ring-hydroxylating ferredoxin subunit
MKASIFKNLFRNFNAKSIAIPSIMMSSYLFYKTTNKQFSTLKQQSNTRRFYISECEGLKHGEMREAKFGPKDEDSLLVVNYDGKIHVLSNKCPHFGAPMHTGYLADRLIKCPWHCASFDITTGQMEQAPSLDDLRTYAVQKDQDGKYYVEIPEDVKQVNEGKVPDMVKRDPNDTRRFVILGGGPAGLSAAQTLRQSGYTGEITILSKDTHLPYDRTGLSKFFPKSIDNILLRSPEFLKEYGIDIVNGVEVTGLNNSKKTVTLDNGKELTYDQLLIATGGRAITPRFKGIEKNKVFTLRGFDDIMKIVENAKNSQSIVIVGASFVGMELASALKKAVPKATVTVIDRTETPFEATLGKEVGRVLQNLHQQNGIQFKLGNGVESIDANKVNLAHGEVEADMVVLAVGIAPNTEFINDSVQLDGKFVVCDKYLKTSDNNIFAAGDITQVPYLNTDNRVSFGHYVSAMQQGSIAALNMLGKNVTYDYVPFFWTRQWDKGLQFTGYGTTWDEVFVTGDLSEYKFAAYYIKDNKIVGFAAMNIPNAANVMTEAFRFNKVPSPSAIKNGSANIDTIKSSLKNVKGNCKKANCCRLNKNI